MDSTLLRSLRPVVTAAEMAAIDKYTITELGVPGRVLMENAGRAAATAIRQKWGDLSGRQIVLVCGKGNNGGDGLVVARYLSEGGAACRVILLGKKSEVRGDALANLQPVEKLGLAITEVTEEQQLPDFSASFLLVDAILGTGSRGGLDVLLAQTVGRMNDSGRPIVALDLPTGIHADSGEVSSPCIRAALSVTFGAVKRGLLFSPAREYAGELHVAEIGFPARAFAEIGVKTYRLEQEAMAAWLPQRLPDTFKNRVGQILVIAGSQGFGGAARLTALAALRAGAGLVVLALPASLLPAMEASAAEVIKLALPEEKGAISFDAKFALTERLTWADVIAVGPGLGTAAPVQALVKQLLSSGAKPIVLDADGLNVLAGRAEKIQQAAAPVILTPHPGELSRLVGKSTDAIRKSPVDTAREVAAELGQTLVLKGAPTVIAEPGGHVFINSTGNAGMATGGSGDVLTGVIAGLLGQLPLKDDSDSLPRAAALGVFLHGLAGDLARDQLGAWAMLAGDILNCLPQAFVHLGNTPDE